MKTTTITINFTLVYDCRDNIRKLITLMDLNVMHHDKSSQFRCYSAGHVLVRQAIADNGASSQTSQREQRTLCSSPDLIKLRTALNGRPPTPVHRIAVDAIAH